MNALEGVGNEEPPETWELAEQAFPFLASGRMSAVLEDAIEVSSLKATGTSFKSCANFLPDCQAGN